MLRNLHRSFFVPQSIPQAIPHAIPQAIPHAIPQCHSAFYIHRKEKPYSCI
jgi:hypothetical protein